MSVPIGTLLWRMTPRLPIGSLRIRPSGPSLELQMLSGIVQRRVANTHHMFLGLTPSCALYVLSLPLSLCPLFPSVPLTSASSTIPGQAFALSENDALGGSLAPTGVSSVSAVPSSPASSWLTEPFTPHLAASVSLSGFPTVLTADHTITPFMFSRRTRWISSLASTFSREPGFSSTLSPAKSFSTALRNRPPSPS